MAKTVETTNGETTTVTPTTVTKPQAKTKTVYLAALIDLDEQIEYPAFINVNGENKLTMKTGNVADFVPPEDSKNFIWILKEDNVTQNKKTVSSRKNKVVVAENYQPVPLTIHDFYRMFATDIIVSDDTMAQKSIWDINPNNAAIDLYFILKFMTAEKYIQKYVAYLPKDKSDAAKLEIANIVIERAKEKLNAYNWFSIDRILHIPGFEFELQANENLTEKHLLALCSDSIKKQLGI